MTALMLVLSVLGVVVGLGLSAVAATSGRRARARAVLVLTAGFVGLYTLVLLAVGATSRPEYLADGQWKCFDDWCVTVVSADAAVSGAADRLVVLQVWNSARRVTQRPDHPQAFLLTDGRATPISAPGLDQRLDAGRKATVRVLLRVPRQAADPLLLVTEGGFPARLVIGDENSPGHAKSVWSL
jgi:hypothetical protein